MSLQAARGRSVSLLLAGLNFLSFVAMVATTLIGLLAVTFVIGRVVPVDPVLTVVGERPSPEVYQRTYQEMGLDRPLLEQFFTYALKAAHGDFGTSVLTGNAVIADISRVAPATFELATAGIIIGVLFGVPLGVLAAVRRGTLIDHIVRVVGLIGHSVPIFWLGLMALLVFYARLDWVPGPGRLDINYAYSYIDWTGLVLLDTALQGEWAAFRNALSHIVLPAILLGYSSLAYISRMTRSFMLKELSQEYVLTARVKGLSSFRVVWLHALRNAAAPLLTVITLSYAGLLEGSVLTETVFAWPGLGQYITNSLQSADMSAVLGGTLVVGVVFLVLNLVSDALYRTLDPRM